MTVETGQRRKPDKKEIEKKEKKGLIWKIVDEIKKLMDKIKFSKGREKEQLQKDLQEKNEERDSLIEKFHGLKKAKGVTLDQKDFIQETEKKKEKFKRQLREAEEQEEFERISSEKKEEIEQHKTREPEFQGDLKEMQGMAEYLLQREIDEAKEKRKSQILGKREKKPDVSEQVNDEEKEELKEFYEALKKEVPNLQKRIAENPKDSEALSKLSHIMGMGPRGGSPYELTKENADKLDSEKGRKEVFMMLLDRYGLDKDRAFRESDMTTTSKWVDFMVKVSKEDPDGLQGFTALFGFEETLHDLERFLKSQANIPDIKKIVGGFQSGDLDVAVRQEGAVIAFRAYEQAYAKLALEEGRFDPALTGTDPSTGKVWIEEWVDKQVEKTLTAYCETNDLDYENDFEPYKRVYLDLGHKILTFTLRAHEMQAELIGTRDPGVIGAPESEDLSRILDPLQLPLRYWPGWHGVEGILGTGKDLATSLFTFLTGEQPDFKTEGEYQLAMNRLREKGTQEEGATEFNFFEIAGILSGSDWRSTEAMRRVIPKELAQFMGIEMHRKILVERHLGWGYAMEKKEAKKEAFEYGLKRNPLGVFLSADQKDQDVVLRNLGIDLIDLDNFRSISANEQDEILRKYDIKVNLSIYKKTEKITDEEAKDEKAKARIRAIREFNIKRRKEFFTESEEHSIYDYTSQALQRLVYRQTKELEGLLLNENSESKKLKGNLSDVEVNRFLIEHENEKLDFSFIPDAEQRKKVEKFIGEIKKHFKADGKAFDRLVKKKQPFSIGTEDAPLELFRFTDLGNQALQRRFRDISAAAEAVHHFWAFLGNLGPIMQKDEEIVKALSEINRSMSNYGFSNSDRIMKDFTHRIIKLIEEDKWQKSPLLPWPLCEWRDKGTWPFSGGLTSKAEELYGQHALSYDKEELRLFIEKLIGAELFAGDKKDIRDIFYNKHKLRRKDILWQKFIRYGPGILVGLTGAAILIVIKQFMKDVEETAKES